MFYLPKGLLVSLGRSVSLVCGNAFLTKIPWWILSFSVISIYQLKTYNFHQYYLYVVLMESVSVLFMFG